MFIDSHCHLSDVEVALRAYMCGVDGMLNAGQDVDEMIFQKMMCEKMCELREYGKAAPLMWTSAGVHPDSAPDKLKSVGIDEILQAAESRFVVAIGECGLDYYYGSAYKKEQKEMFERHVEASGLSGLPLMIHERKAEKDMLEILKKYKAQYPKLSGVIHCFSSDANFAREILDLGFYISASGLITFSSAGNVREVFKTAPKDRVLLETDSPYLAPVPYRGKENEPAYVLETADRLARIWRISSDDVAEMTSDNFYNLYEKAKITM